MNKMDTDGILFDLDGTLWDSGEGVAEGVGVAVTVGLTASTVGESATTT